MTEQSREKMLKYLTSEYIGISREEAELLLADDDLWIVEPQRRFPFAGEEAVREWSKAVTFARFLCEGFAAGPFYGELANEFKGAIQQMLWDMEERAKEALRRAKERAAATSGQVIQPGSVPNSAGLRSPTSEGESNKGSGLVNKN
jgi:hypothetical protein